MDGPEYAIGRFTLRPHRQLLAEGAPVVIRRKALDLLSVLAEAQGALVTKDELMTRVWARTVVEENALQVQVAALRKLLGDDGALLTTVRGLGYRLTATPRVAASPRQPETGGGGADPPTFIDRPRQEQVTRDGARRFAPRALRLAGALGLTLLVSAASASPPHEAVTSDRLPADPAAAALYVQARDEWAQRDAASLSRSIAHLERVTRLAPRFAPAFADLADAYLLAGEAGSLPDAVAYDGAGNAAARALSLDPRSAGAHRATGFILYWWRHDRRGAADAFRTALRLDPDAAQTHFWYANVLADNGEFAPAMREFDRARLAEPGSDQIGGDYAWALWSAGREADAIAALRAITAKSPQNAEAQDCLAVALLAAGDDAGYLAGLRARARVRHEPGLDARVSQLAGAYARGGGEALLRTATALEMAAQVDAPYPDHSDAAFYASLAGDRPAMLAALTAADAGREQWGSAGYVRRIRSRWTADGPVIAALDRRAAPRLQPGS